MRFNGWQRLWVVISVAYLIPVAFVVVAVWPTNETTWHRDEFIDRMPAEYRAQVKAAYRTKWDWKEAGGPADPAIEIYSPIAEDAPNRSIPPPPDTAFGGNIGFENRAVLQLLVQKGAGGVDRRVARAYWAVVEAETRTARISTLAWAILLWATPCALLYLSGWAVAWIRRGFR
jgi:hypothetical protein